MDKSFGRYKFENDFRTFMNTYIWYKLQRHGFPRLASRMIHRLNYGDRIIHGDSDTNMFIKSLIENDKPCMVSRFGQKELSFLIAFLNDKAHGSVSTGQKLEDAFEGLCLNAGFFPRDLSLGEKFFKIYINSISEMDVCGVWNLFMEDYILDKYAPNCFLSELAYLEPWNTKDSIAWSALLKGKRVLVVHPFQETIEKQYKKHEHIFDNKFSYENIFPEIDLVTVKAVQSIGGENDEYSNWFDALNGMLGQIRSLDFDVAIIGCGAYGLPIAAEIKKMGKKAIHLGGATQLMFGIWGHRWDQIEGFNELRNEYWILPSESEKPRRADEIENGCYW